MIPLPSDSHPNARSALIMEEGLFKFYEDWNVCACATCCPCCLQGSNMAYFGDSCATSCLVCPWTVGCQTSTLNEHFGAQDRGWIINWCTSLLFPCCAVARNTRAVNSWLQERVATQNMNGFSAPVVL